MYVNNRNVLLSVCIPNYNRILKLKRLLISILEQITEKISDEIEICVSDNCSDINPEKMINDLREKYKYGNIVFFRNEENLGAAINTQNVVDMAQGKYCWIIGNDDCVYPDTIPFIIDKLQMNERADLVSVVFDNYNHEIQRGERLYQTRSHSEEYYSIKSAEEFEKYFACCADYYGGNQGLFCFLSNIIFLKMNWKKYCRPEILNVNSIYFPALVHLETLKNGAELLVLTLPVILRSCEGDGKAIMHPNYFYNIVKDMHELIGNYFSGELALQLDMLEIPREETVIENFLNSEIEIEKKREILKIIFRENDNYV